MKRKIRTVAATAAAAAILSTGLAACDSTQDQVNQAVDEAQNSVTEQIPNPSQAVEDAKQQLEQKQEELMNLPADQEQQVQEAVDQAQQQLEDAQQQLEQVNP